MDNFEIKDFMLIVDHKKHIQSIYPSESFFSSYVNLKVEEIVTKNSKERLNDFMEKLNHANVTFHHPMLLNYRDLAYSCHMNGYKDDQNIYIFVLFNTSTDEEVFKKILQLNSQQVNEIRMIRKDFQIQDNQIYDEISKLNSELLNSKRIIEKQNSELQRYNILLKKMSIEDPLTGCYNRRHFNDYIKEAILTSQKDVFHSMIMIDFNNFKMVNDQFGHDAGDRLLILFVNTTKKIIQGKGNIFRIGGDEFMIILNEMNKDQSLSYIKMIEAEFSKNSTVASLSYGLIEFNESEINHDFDLTNLINKADQLMYADKRSKKV